MKRVKRVVVRSGDELVEVGHLLQGEDGSIKIKLDSLPTGDFDGWIEVCDLIADD